MNLTLRQLHVFESVATHLSFTRAAQTLFLTQPAVSMQIKQLEGQLGVALFEQVGKTIHLTETGKEVLLYPIMRLCGSSARKTAVYGGAGIPKFYVEGIARPSSA